MGAAQGIRMKNPAHPGGFVKSKIVEALGLSVTDAARMLGGHAARVVRAAQRAGKSFAGNGAPDRKGVRRIHGYADEDADES